MATTLRSASHAQLSLLGYGGHGRCDQLATGCWGETVCFDMDMSLVDLAVSGGRVLQNYPIVIHVEKPEVTVAIQGGIGAVPIRFEGLESNKG